MWLIQSVHVRALAGYLLVAMAFAWPLPVLREPHVLGAPSGDTGVYLWNLWVFRHELLAGHNPYFTSTIMAPDRVVDLSLHNYTVIADVLALPLISLLGVVQSFNAVFMVMRVLGGYTAFLLARAVSRADAPSWLAGVLFLAAPSLVARTTAHLSLVIVAPLVLFFLVLRRIDREPGWLSGVLAGLVLALATFSDPYYGVYCALLAFWHVASYGVSVRAAVAEERTRWPRTRRFLDTGIALSATVALWIALTGGGRVDVATVAIHVRTLHTPILLLTVLVCARLALRFRARFDPRAAPWRGLVKVAAAGTATAAVLLAPMLYALLTGVTATQSPAPRVLWRSSTPGVDLAAMLAPNPNHPLFAWISRDFLARLDGGFAENVATIPLVAVAVLVAAWWRAGFRWPPYWTALAAVFAALAAGPFLRFAGANLYVPTPWAFLRYAPLVGAARAPARFMALVMIALAVLFALALKALLDRYPARRGLVMVCVSAALIFELSPAPRRTFLATIPSIYDRVAADPRPVRVLEIPYGLRDGLSSFGNYSAGAQFYQTRHGKELLGGYISRLTPDRVDFIRSHPVLAPLTALSEGQDVPVDAWPSPEAGRSLVRDARIGYVVIDARLASPSLVAFAERVLDLELLDGTGDRKLYRPVERSR